MSAICAVGTYFIISPPYVDGALPMTFMGAQGLFVDINRWPSGRRVFDRDGKK